MSASRTRSLDLFLDLDMVTCPLRARRVTLEGRLREAILGGRLSSGIVLPSTRAMARELGISRGTVVEAYAELVAEGYLQTARRMAPQP